MCVVAGVLALFGVPSAAGVFGGLGGMVLGALLALTLVPRREVGLTARTILALLAVGGMVVGGTVLSVFDFHTVGGLLSFGLYFGFCSAAASRLTPT